MVGSEEYAGNICLQQGCGSLTRCRDTDIMEKTDNRLNHSGNQKAFFKHALGEIF